MRIKMGKRERERRSKETGINTRISYTLRERKRWNNARPKDR